MSKKIIWIEDNDEDDISDLLKQGNNLDVIKVKDLDQLAILLDKCKNDDIEIKGFVVDMMLSGPNTLASFGINEKWDHLLADAGEKLIRHVLRNNKFSYQDIPILILSVRTNLDENKYENTTTVIKRDALNTNKWREKITKWIRGLS